jgi:antitoxin component of RelBE/YafQ-DinJ toxin-antitoxin module
VLSCDFVLHLAMAIVPKTSVLQIRMDPRLLERFKAVCEQTGSKPTQAARLLLETYVIHAENRLAKASRTASEAIEAARVPPLPSSQKKTPVQPSTPSVARRLTVSERLKLEREAKKAKIKRREDRWFKD